MERALNLAAPPGLAKQLSASELRVLRYLPTNLTRSEIAGELSVSLNTVNTHIRRIYAKLGANVRAGPLPVYDPAGTASPPFSRWSATPGRAS